MTLTDLTIWNNYTMLLLAAIGMINLVTFIITSLLLASQKDANTVAGLRYETLRLRQHWCHWRSGCHGKLQHGVSCTWIFIH